MNKLSITFCTNIFYVNLKLFIFAGQLIHKIIFVLTDKRYLKYCANQSRSMKLKTGNFIVIRLTTL